VAIKWALRFRIHQKELFLFGFSTSEISPISHGFVGFLVEHFGFVSLLNSYQIAPKAMVETDSSTEGNGFTRDQRPSLQVHPWLHQGNIQVEGGCHDEDERAHDECFS